VPSLPANYGVSRLLAGGNMEPPNDTSSVANMSLATVTGTVFGPGVTTAAQHNQASSLMDYFGSPAPAPPRYEELEENMVTTESEVM